MPLTLFRKRLGVSEIVASLVLMLIVSSLGVFLYSVTTSTTNTQIDIARTEASREIQRARERFRIVSASRENNNYTIAVLNYGEIDIILSGIYVNGEVVTNPSEPLQSLELKLINFQYSSSSNSTLMITIVTARGISHSYSYNSDVN